MHVDTSFSNVFFNRHGAGNGLLIALLFLLSACSVTPPVQEMSDARQAIRAAKEANAEEYAPQKLRSAEDSMDLATRTLEQGEFEAAKMAASVAKALAIKARDAAVAAASDMP